MTSTKSLELWAGAECTVNRVGDRFFDQIERTGHATRPDDLERIAALGARACRFPVLWERSVPAPGAAPDFRWSDPRLEALRERRIRPIVGLVHHGSGPPFTDLARPSFADGLADFARSVAERYPWVEDYTPVNEPGTTARFGGLYGHWYPHGRDTRTFFALLVNEIAATRRAMQKIREVTPGARLVQTEDFGRVLSTQRLAYQRDYENARQLLSLDLLAGRVDRTHPMRGHLEGAGIDVRLLDEMVGEPCPPDVVGVNYYVTSDRFLDERVDRYPAHVRGGNDVEPYADVEAVRVRGASIAGFRRVLVDAWERYRIPLAITEAHIGCSREEQLRWLAEAWDGAREARAAGADVRAVTLWSVFGTFDWNSLVTRDDGYYEPGAYDVRSPAPRATALAGLAKQLATEGRARHPVLATRGWWHRRSRYLYEAEPAAPAMLEEESCAARPVLVLGSTPLASHVHRVCRERGLPVLGLASFDAGASAREAPWAAVYAEPGGDVAGPRSRGLEDVRLLAGYSKRHDIPLLVFSEGPAHGARRPERHPGAALEAVALGSGARVLVVRRTPAPGARGAPFHDLVGAALDLLVDEERGLFEVAVVPGGAPVQRIA
jgi:dTDP-4-dehydrorhamnose reductase